MERTKEKFIRLNRAGDLNASSPEQRLLSMADVHRVITLHEGLAEITRQYRELADKTERKEWKRSHLPSVEFNSVCEGIRCIDNVRRMTGYIVVDIDDLESTSQAELVRDNLFNDSRLGCVLAFVSIGGNGVKAVLDIGEDKVTATNIKDWYKAVSFYLRSTYSLEVDTNAFDAVRLCYLSHDRDARFNAEGGECSVDVTWATLARERAERLRAARKERNAGRTFTCRYDGNQLADLLRMFAELCTSRNLSYLDGYDQWIGFGSEVRKVFGGSSEGMEVWDACSRNSRKYNRRDLVRKWNQLPDSGGEVTVVGMLHNMAKSSVSEGVNLRTWLHITMRKLGMLGTTVVYD